jgi:spore coat polysaccharide biosynthesis predicted glycosyltransferase SpsG
MPNEIYTENEFFKSIYEEAGYKNVSIMKNIPRLKYLSNIKRINIVNNTILIACGMHDYRYFIDHCLDEIYSNLNFNYIFKFHPKTNYDSFADKINRYKFKNLKVGDKHISVYLSYVSEVIVSYSSVGYEAYCLGIPVKVKCLPNRINESPLLDLFKSNSSLITIDYN